VFLDLSWRMEQKDVRYVKKVIFGSCLAIP
jgi:hypothetical protein